MKRQMISPAAPTIQLGSGRMVVAAAWMIVCTAVLLVAADLLRMMADSSGAITGTIDSNAGAASMEASLASIANNPGVHGAATVLTFLTAFVAVPAVLLGWRLCVNATPVLAWITATVGLLFVFGRVIHSVTAFALPLILAQTMPADQAGQLYQEINLHWSSALVIIPTIVGIALWFPLLAVALYRAHVIPLLAMISVLVGTVVLLVLGSSYLATPIFGVLTVAGLLPVVSSAGNAHKDAGAAAVLAAAAAN
ncbi:hypothetical protein [Arthrobacter sp.]|uniref:hypothetical protein n=1 Tax=Arthrobacter sp. TaxID=1667 RepID=UPI0026E0B1D1|nr:hypothetical protein [Arthrobacter sp.]MDO5751546.1 hypothetical protein [Arthrobacter sp.]